MYGINSGLLHEACQNRLMGGFSLHTGKMAVYNEDNIDTDRIIPARFLSMVTKQGYGELLFADVRGAGFPLDLPQAQGASILVVGENFGCGSSREHAVWAIQQAGFKAVVAHCTPENSGYSDIFRQNAANCGLLLIELPSEQHQLLVSAGTGSEATIDLTSQTISIGEEEISFEITQQLKEQIMKGQDLIGTTLVYEDEISEFEKQSRTYVPKPESGVGA